MLHQKVCTCQLSYTGSSAAIFFFFDVIGNLGLWLGASSQKTSLRLEVHLNYTLYLHVRYSQLVLGNLSSSSRLDQ